MARLALVSRNPMMSMGLSAIDHDIEEVRAGSLDDWIAQGNDSMVDALVLDLGSPSQALRLVGDLRASGRWVPALLVTDESPGWGSSDLTALPGVDFVSLPIDATKLKAAVERVLRHPAAPPAPVAHLTQPMAQHHAPLLDEIVEPPAVAEPALLTPDPLLDELVEPTSPVDLLSTPNGLADLPPDPEPSAKEPLEVPQQQVVATPEPVVHNIEPAEPAEIPIRAVVPEPETEPLVPPAKPRRRNRRPPSPTDGRNTGARTTAPPRRRATDHLDDLGTAVMVRALLDGQSHLYSLQEASEVIVDDALRRAQADAGALLVPDGEVWRVTGGVGLRSLESRYQLTQDSWLVERVGASQRGIIILDSDIARADLRGAPLASRHHLMAVPIPQVRALLILGRDAAPGFDEDILHELADVAAEAGPLLERATAVRQLARALQRHLDLVEAPAR